MEVIDFVIPCHPKDIETVELGVYSIQKLSCSNNVYLISPEDLKLKGTIQILDREFDSYCSLNIIKEIWKEKNERLSYRSSWIYQQLLKLNTHKIISDLTESYVIVDADTFIISDVDFDPNIFQYCIASEYHKPYLETYEKIMKRKPNSGFSFIYHHMVFNKKFVQELIDYIEKIHNKKLFDVIVDNINYNEASTFSEWDLYANWMWDNHKDLCVNRQLKYACTNNIPTKKSLDELQIKTDIDIMSAHAWIRGIE
jgi:hypothetical protein